MQADPVEIDPKHYQVVFENAKVQVLRVSLGPHERAPMHSHPSTVIVHLTDHHSKSTDPAGTAFEMHNGSGEVQWTDPTDHSTENLSSKPIELIQVELKS